MKKIVALVSSMLMIVACSGAGGGDDLFKTDTSNTHPTPDAGEQKDSSSPVDAGQVEQPDAYVSPTPGCTPESDKDYCGDKNCGVLIGFDNCGGSRSIGCGPSTCGKGYGCVANKCTACVPKTCKELAFTCGQANDGCNPVPLECGVCVVGDTCTNNVCVPPACVAETNVAFCSRTVSNCGTKTAADNCGVARTVPSCGTLTFNGISGMSMAGGVPAEMAGAVGVKYIEAWINPTNNTTSIVQVGSGGGQGTFSLSLLGGNLVVSGQTVTGVPVPLNTWTFVFAGITGGNGVVGKIVNNVITTQSVNTGLFGTALLAGDSVVIGSSFVGQMNQIRLWSKVPNTANYHDCMPGEVGLIRQWCFREGSGVTTSDSLGGVTSTLNGAIWTTGVCN